MKIDFYFIQYFKLFEKKYDEIETIRTGKIQCTSKIDKRRVQRRIFVNIFSVKRAIKKKFSFFIINLLTFFNKKIYLEVFRIPSNHPYLEIWGNIEFHFSKFLFRNKRSNHVFMTLDVPLKTAPIILQFL